MLSAVIYVVVCFAAVVLRLSWQSEHVFAYACCNDLFQL